LYQGKRIQHAAEVPSGETTQKLFHARQVSGHDLVVLYVVKITRALALEKQIADYFSPLIVCERRF
jgi:hypothetical protein